MILVKANCGIFTLARTKLMTRRTLEMTSSSGVAVMSHRDKGQGYSEGTRTMENLLFPPKVLNFNFPVTENQPQSISFNKRAPSKTGFIKEIDKLIAEYQRNPQSYREVIYLLKCAKECETRTEESKEVEFIGNLVDSTTASEDCPQDNALRGVLIVFEGADCSGKSTQSSRLQKELKRRSHKVRLMRFPDRSTSIGQVISAYLEKKLEMNDRTIHLLFSANRWEFVQQMHNDLAAGVTLVLDRYAFSGVAYSASKPEIVGSGSEDDVHQRVLATVEPVLVNASKTPLGHLWNKQY
uniref:dTMP kinase n=1 Tax=Eptatretus burgeri TaxID=7764 RepID=A0A8C4Q8P2_EPTBU